MSWLYSQALVEEYLVENSLDGEQYAPLSLNPMPHAYLPKDKMTDFSRPSRFGMTFGHLTERLGVELLTWFLAGFPARTSVQQEPERASKASDPGCGWKWRESSVKYDPASCLWKTRQCSLLGDLELYSETWPRWGLMRDGECWAQQTLARRTKETESGLWPTPNCPNGGRRVPDDAEIRGGRTPTAYKNGKKMQVGLEQAVKWWPTPTKSDGTGGPGNQGRAGGLNLRTAVSKWPTPKANDAEKRGNFDVTNPRNGLPAAVKRYMTPTASIGSKCGGRHKGKADTLASQIAEIENMEQTSTGQLNPTWVEWLMGWPEGWTDLKPWGTDKCQSVPLRHGAC